MGKRQEIRARRRRQQTINRIIVIGLVVLGALFITVALALPAIRTTQIRATQQAALTSAPSTQVASLTAVPVKTIVPRAFTAPVNRNSLGDPNALVKVDVWEDFQCSSCLTFYEKYEPQVIQNYVETGKIYYTFHFFPLISNYSPGNTESEHAANASLCAADQGKFWEYHDMLFTNWNGENQGAFADIRLVAFAQELGLDMTAFNQCFSTDKYADFIAQDLQAGQAWGVNGTPSVFVNGTIVSPGYVATYDDISKAIEAILKP